MHFSSTLVAVAALAMGARADLDIDLNDTPRECRDICKPLDDLHRDCEVDLRDDRDREEDQLEAQCFCTNDSFEVSAVSSNCHDCIRQAIEKRRNDNNNGNNNDNNRDFDDDDDDDDDLWEGDGDDDDELEDWRDAYEDLNDILRSCGFGTTSYTADATSLVSGITVSASRPTDASQLTTTFTRGPAPTTTGGPAPTSTGSNGGGSGGSNDDNNNDNNDDNNDDNNNSGNGSSDNNDSSNNDDNSDDNNDDNNDNAAGVLSPVYFAGAIVAGAMAFA